MTKTEEKKRKGSYRFLLEFELKSKQDCNKFLNIFRRYKKNILLGCYYEKT